MTQIHALPEDYIHAQTVLPKEELKVDEAAMINFNRCVLKLLNQIPGTITNTIQSDYYTGTIPQQDSKQHKGQPQATKNIHSLHISNNNDWDWVEFQDLTSSLNQLFYVASLWYSSIQQQWYLQEFHSTAWSGKGLGGKPTTNKLWKPAATCSIHILHLDWNGRVKKVPGHLQHSLQIQLLIILIVWA